MSTLELFCLNCPAGKSCVFNRLPDNELKLLEAKKRPFELKKGSLLNVQGTPALGAYCIARGHCKVIWPEQGQVKESIVKIVVPGDMAGYRCLFSDTCFRATAETLGSVQGCFIPKEVLFELMERNPKFSFAILERMGKEIRLAEKRLHSFCTKNVRERMAEILLHMNELASHEENGHRVLDIYLTREEMASWIGTAKETVVRCLSDMKEEGLIEQGPQGLVLVDISALAKIVGNL